MLAVVFAGCYYGIMHNDPETKDIATYGHAFIAALQIQSTIGFAAPSQKHWTHNWLAVTLVACHSVSTILFNVFLLGTLFSRISSAKNRAITVRFSKKLVVSVTGGASPPIIQFRLGEIRRRQLLNLNVSAFLYSHRDSVLFDRQQLHIDPSSGILLSVPIEVTHVIDHTSPIWHFLTESSSKQPALDLRDYSCQVCGDIFSSLDQLQRHLRYKSDASHRRIQADFVSLSVPSIEVLRKSVSTHMANKTYFELIVLVEGIEPVTGSAMQMRYSYGLHDIEFNARFDSCQELDGTKLTVDFSRFDSFVVM